MEAAERRLYTHSLMYACHVADARVAGIALACGADPGGLTHDHTTPLHAVCDCSSYWDPTRRAEQRTKIEKRLLDRGADALSGKEHIRRSRRDVQKDGPGVGHLRPACRHRVQRVSPRPAGLSLNHLTRRFFSHHAAKKALLKVADVYGREVRQVHE